MKKLFYYLLFPSILFSQTTPSVTPRADGEGSLGTETYRWGEGHFDELYSTAPSLADDSNRVPTTAWVNNLIQSDDILVDYIYKNTSFTAEPYKKYSVDTSLGDITVTLPELTEEMIGSPISIRHTAGSNNIIVNRSGTNTITEASSYTSYSFKGQGSYLDIAAYTESVWLIIRSSRVAEPAESSDTNVAATTAWVRDLVGDNYLKNQGAVTLEGSLTLEGSVSTEASNGMTFLSSTNNTTLDKIYNRYGYMGTEVDTFYLDYSDSSSLTKLFSYAGLDTANKYGEFFIPLKAPTPTAADDSTNVATTAWVQDEIATKQDASNAVTTDTSQTITGAKTFRAMNLYYGPAEATNHYPFAFGCGSTPFWRSMQYTGGNLVIQCKPTESSIWQAALAFIFQSGGTTPYVQLYNNATGVTQSADDNSTKLATTAFVQAQKASPALTGTPTAPTAAAGTNTTQIASTAFVQAKASGALLTEGTPASSSATGTKGMIRYDADYVYICTATDTWIRIAKDTW